STGLSRPSGSALFSHRPAIATPPAAPRRSVPPAPLGSSLQLHLSPLSLRLRRGPPDFCLGHLSHGLLLGPPDPRVAWTRRHSISASGSTSTCSLAIPSPWLFPPSALPWAAILAVAWALLGSSCSGSLLSPPWLLPPSDLPWTLLSPPWLLPPSSPPWTFPSSTRAYADFLLPSHVHSFVHLLSPLRP
ncbi:hypothetical protein M9458_048677, partial [Cirrhinus mrigala]